MVSCLAYDPTCPSYLRNMRTGKPAGTLRRDGYYDVLVNGKKTKAHHIIWSLFGREIPEGFVLDHKEGKSNDIDNLRLATVSQNAQNSKLMSNNTSGHKGVELAKGGLWRVRISAFKGKRMSFGCYKDSELACLVADEARDKYHGQFSRHA